MKVVYSIHPPIPATGRQGIWHWKPEPWVLEAIRKVE
jgi:hypothetical protein